MDISTPNLNKPFTPPVPQRKEPLGSFSGTAVKRPSGTFNWFGALSFIIFFGVVCWWAGLYGYQYILKKEKADIEAQIANLAKGFQIVTFDNLEALGNRLSFAQNIIDKHTALLPLLCFLEKNTLTKSVSYNGLTYSADGDQEGPLKLTLLGRANSFASLAYQAKVFTDENAFARLDFSNLSVDDADGKINFTSNINLNPDLIRYQQGLPDTCATGVVTAATSSVKNTP